MNSKLIIQGFIAGVEGVVAMTLAEKLEQVITKRPNSYVPDHTLRRLLGDDSSTDKVCTNLAMHWGQGILLENNDSLTTPKHQPSANGLRRRLHEAVTSNRKNRPLNK